MTAPNTHQLQPLTSINIVSHNVNKQPPLPHLLHLLATHNIIFLQEVFTWDNHQLSTLQLFHPHTSVYHNTNSKDHGVLIAIREDLAAKVLQLPTTDTRQQVLAITLQLPHTTLQLINLYGSSIPAEQQHILSVILPLMQSNLPTILIGDINHTPQPKLDTFNIKHPSKWKWLEHKLATGELIDAFRHTHPREVQFTRYKGYGTGKSRIDLALLPLKY